MVYQAAGKVKAMQSDPSLSKVERAASFAFRWPLRRAGSSVSVADGSGLGSVGRAVVGCVGMLELPCRVSDLIRKDLPGRNQYRAEREWTGVVPGLAKALCVLNKTRAMVCLACLAC